MFRNTAIEQGPIRPPNEAESLLLRVTRNCPWNRCLFCPVYKGKKFSRRSLEEIKGDIDQLSGTLPRGNYNVFLQDADSLILKTEDLVEIINYLYQKLPGVSRVTSYARSRTLARKSVEELTRLKNAGLTRVHVGLESGCDEVLDFVKKGVTSAEQIEAGKRVKEAGLLLSHYIILGLGGKERWKEHAQDTAAVINAVNPDFIRVRTLTLRPNAPMAEEYHNGNFTHMEEEEMVEEEKLLVENLSNITSTLYSDHILNLLEGVQGTFPHDKEAMLKEIEEFRSLSSEEKTLFIVGRRAGILRYPADRHEPHLKKRVELILSDLEKQGVSPKDFLREMMLRYI